MSTTAEFRIVPITQLHESPLNPRKLFDPARLQELVDSVRAHGVRTPLLVRPNAGGFEIAAGHRRYRAAKAAGLAEVPAVVQPMDDVAFIELLSFDNLQRQDMTPLEEADGYRLLMTKAGYTVERIAERIGMSVKYVYDRIKLLQLVPEAQKLLREDKIAAGHAILLARLKPDDQKRAINPESRAVFQHENLLWDPNEEGKPYKAPHDGLKAVSVRELEKWIDEHVRFDPAKAEPMLFPETVGALAHAKEQAEKIVPITHEHYIPPEAREGRTFGPRSWKRADGKHKSKPCERSVTGVIVVGPGRGEAFKVCIDKEKCATHWAAERREAKRRAEQGGKRGTTGQDRWEREEQKRKEEEARREAERARWKKATPAILEAVAAAVKKAPTRAGGLLAKLILEEVRPCDAPRTSPDYVPLGTTAEDLVRHAAFVILHAAAVDWRAPEQFPKYAKGFGIDVREILDRVAPKPAAAAAAAETAPAKAAGKGKKS